MKRFVSIFLLFALVVSAFTFSANAATSNLVGDANGDGVLDIRDATCIQLYLVGKDTSLCDNFSKIADTNDDGEVSIRDATLIQMKLVRLINDFPRKDLGQEATQPTTQSSTDSDGWGRKIYKP